MPKRIFVAEDTPSIQRLFNFYLKKTNYQVEIEGSGKKALERMIASPPDLLLLDLVLPDMSGLEILQNIRFQKNLSNLITIVVTADSNSRHLNAAIEMGASDYLIKPFQLDALLEKIEKWINFKK